MNTLKISKPEKAAIFENMVLRMAQTGQLRGKLDDAQFVSILESVNAQMPQSKSTVKYDRRRAAIDSDDDDDYGCWLWLSSNDDEDEDALFKPFNINRVLGFALLKRIKTTI